MAISETDQAFVKDGKVMGDEGRVGDRVRGGWQGVGISLGIQLNGQIDLFQIVQTGCAVGLRLRFGQSRQQERGQNGDDYQQFHQGEGVLVAFSLFESRVSP